MWVKFPQLIYILSCACFNGFSPGTSVFLPLKINTGREATSRSSVLVSVKRYPHKRKSEKLGKRFKMIIFKANDNVFF